tara:strand:+ start:347 stop:535 length:189 start_codon:yes stop_codon:yes gene_type:complete
MGNYLSGPNKVFDNKNDFLKEVSKNKNTIEDKNIPNHKEEKNSSQKKNTTENEIKENPFFFF